MQVNQFSSTVVFLFVFFFLNDWKRAFVESRLRSHESVYAVWVCVLYGRDWWRDCVTVKIIYLCMRLTYFGKYPSHSLSLSLSRKYFQSYGIEKASFYHDIPTNINVNIKHIVNKIRYAWVFFALINRLNANAVNLKISISWFHGIQLRMPTENNNNWIQN